LMPINSPFNQLQNYHQKRKKLNISAITNGRSSILRTRFIVMIAFDFH
jgi:hypothetical protein